MAREKLTSSLDVKTQESINFVHFPPKGGRDDKRDCFDPNKARNASRIP